MPPTGGHRRNFEYITVPSPNPNRITEEHEFYGLAHKTLNAKIISLEPNLYLQKGFEVLPSATGPLE